MSTKSRTTRRSTTIKFAVCVKNAGYEASLELHKIYRVLRDDDAAADGDLRIVDESGEDYLYPADWFAAIDVPRRVRTPLLRGQPIFNPHNFAAGRTVVRFARRSLQRSQR